MEEERDFNLAQSQIRSKPLESIEWQWQSDADPWQEADSSKWTWQSYSDEECAILEQAFYLNKEEVDLAAYEIDFKRMLQVNKESRDRIRRVRRQGNNEFLIKISEPRPRQTINEAFGTTHQFLEFIAKRTPEAYRIYQRLTLHLQNQGFEDVIQQVVNCVEKAAQTITKITKTRSRFPREDLLSQGKDIVDFIRANSATLENFLRSILKVYMLESFICYWTDELLQSEDWEEINVLTPYLVCLIYIFQLPEFSIRHQEPQGLVNLIGKQKLYLFRGTSLSTEQLELFTSGKVKYFSWNKVTSTSRDRTVAIKLMFLSSSAKFGSNIQVLFSIETDFASLQDCEGMIDVSRNSMYPQEQEVLLAPATVFKILKTRLSQINFFEVSLKIMKKFDVINENIPLLGTLLDESLLKDKAIIKGLPSQRTFKLLNLLKGNKLVRMIEIRNSIIDENLLELIEDMRRTTKVRKEDVKIIESTITIRSYSSLVHYFLSESLADIITRNKIVFQEGDGRLKKSWKIQLILKEEALKKLQKDGQLKEFWENIKQDIQTTSLEVSMIKMQIKSFEFGNFLDSIKEMKHLDSLSLILNINLVKTAEGISHFCNTIESLSALKQLSIALDLSDKELKLFKKSLSLLISLQYLHLDFKLCKQISDEGLDHLKTALISLKPLQYLSLNLKGCDKISDEGLDHLRTTLQSLSSLQTLSLDFNDCHKISDDGLNHLKIALISITSLQYLTLNCSWCNELSNTGLDHIKTALLSLTSLKLLSFDFTRCDRISDKGLKELHSGLASLKSLHYLSLHFARCFKISDEGLNHLSTAMLHLTSLHHLSLDFTKCDKISNEGLKDINMGLVALKALRNLSLNFHDCSMITEEGLHHFQAGLTSLSSLQHLFLNFSECINISSRGLSHLKIALTSLLLLQHLSLDLTRCEKISDEGLKSLSIGLTSLKHLKHLYMNFGWCHGLSDHALNQLKTALLSLTLLQHLSLDFTWCDKITNEGFKSLASSLKSLKSLQYISLNFSYCQQISDEKLCFLKYMLAPLEDLQYLSLNFSGCRKITNQALTLLKDGLKFIPYFECHQSLFL